MSGEREVPKAMSLLAAMEKYVCPQFFEYRELFIAFDEGTPRYPHPFKANDPQRKVSQSLGAFRDRMKSQTKHLDAYQVIRVQELSQSLEAAQTRVHDLEEQLKVIKRGAVANMNATLRMNSKAREMLARVHRNLFPSARKEDVPQDRYQDWDDYEKKYSAKEKELKEEKEKLKLHKDEIFIEAVLSVALVRKVERFLLNSQLPGEKIEDWINMKLAAYLKPSCPTNGSAMPRARRWVQDRATTYLETKTLISLSAPAAVRNIFSAKRALEGFIKLNKGITMDGGTWDVCFSCKNSCEVVTDPGGVAEISDMVIHFVENCGKCRENGHEVSTCPTHVRLGICGVCNPRPPRISVDTRLSRSAPTIEGESSCGKKHVNEDQSIEGGPRKRTRKRKKHFSDPQTIEEHANHHEKHTDEDQIPIPPQQVEKPDLQNEEQISPPAERTSTPTAIHPQKPPPNPTPHPIPRRSSRYPPFDPLAYCTTCNQKGHDRKDCDIDYCCGDCWKLLRPFEGPYEEAEAWARDHDDICIGLDEFCHPYVFSDTEEEGGAEGKDVNEDDNAKNDYNGEADEDMEVDNNKAERLDEDTGKDQAADNGKHEDEHTKHTNEDKGEDRNPNKDEVMEQDDDSDDEIKVWDGENFVALPC